MLNLANYVHPNFRLMWRRHKVQIAAIFCIFLAFYIIKDLIKSGKTPRKRTASSLRDDEFVMLRSQNGYLKVRKSQKQLIFLKYIITYLLLSIIICVCFFSI